MYIEKTPLLVADPDSALQQSGYTNDLMRSHYTTDGKMLKYDAGRVSSLASIARVGGTVFLSRVPWFWALCYSVLWAIVFVGFRCLGPFHTQRGSSGFGDLTLDVAVFMGLLLAMHMGEALKRWLEMRHDVIGGLWTTIDDIALLLAVQLKDTADRPLKTLALRYGLCSVELLLASESDQPAALEFLCRRGLLSRDEREQLLLLPAKSKVLWVWTACLFQRLASKGRISSSALGRLYELCNRGRLACDRATTFGHSQLPMMYTHLLVVLAHLACALVSVRGGMVAAALSWDMSPEKGAPPASKTGAFYGILGQLLMAAVVPMCYSALLRYAATLSDPLSPESVEGMPFSAYRVFMRDECEAFHTAGENAPKAVARAVELVEEDEETPFMHDLAHVIGSDRA
mmetsp:Transcript_143575/g.459234  ORF Transcript_143575/g.459234 Transcript_143575/m.459234 type:complete len:401 (+) Transcript_143575:163-1365(+)